jgi:biopolymer transport protein ExbB
MKILNYLIVGGVFMWPILLALICGLAVILEKAYYFLRNENDMTDKFKKNLIKLIQNGNKAEIIEYCNTKKNSVAKTIKNTLETFESDTDFDPRYLEEIAKETTLEQISALEKGMWLLNIVATVSPQLGLLGTVTGMVGAFKGLAGASGADSAMIAGGISEALYTTAFGLLVGIPALVAYNFFDRKIDNVLMEVERMTVYLTNTIQNKNCHRKNSYRVFNQGEVYEKFETKKKN